MPEGFGADRCGAGPDGWNSCSTVEYKWDGANTVEEVDSRSGFVTEYFMNPNSMLGNVMGVKKDGVWYYPMFDSMGTVWQVANAAGLAITTETRDFDAWGNELKGLLNSSSCILPSLGWQSKPWDEETGMWYSRARWYDARVGRFTQVDPATSNVPSCTGRMMMGGQYSAYENNPTATVDPLGLWGVDVHRSMSGLGFDYGMLDESPETNPATATWRHFVNDPNNPFGVGLCMALAVRKCDGNAFRDCGHMGQDTFSHRGAGVSPGEHVLRSALSMLPGLGSIDPDSVLSHGDAFDAALEWTQRWEKKWRDCGCPMPNKAEQGEPSRAWREP